MEHLYDLITVMMVDGRIDEKELFLCKSLAVKLGCSEEIRRFPGQGPH